jgi:hypothetical protein
MVICLSKCCYGNMIISTGAKSLWAGGVRESVSWDTPCCEGCWYSWEWPWWRVCIFHQSSEEQPAYSVVYESSGRRIPYSMSHVSVPGELLYHWLVHRVAQVCLTSLYNFLTTLRIDRSEEWARETFILTLASRLLQPCFDQLLRGFFLNDYNSQNALF